MKLSEQDVRQFYSLMRPLHYYVNQAIGINDGIDSISAFMKCDIEEIIEVRDALFADPELIDSFLKDNPQLFSKEEREIITLWKNAVVGEFYIERYLKRHAIFIHDKDVYGVLGLSENFEDMIHRSHLPFLCKTVLLPFKGKIIYDGFYHSYSIHFGGGIKRQLKELYMRARQNDRIIESLDPAYTKPPRKKPSKPIKDWGPELDELAERANKLRKSSGHPEMCSPAFGIVKASIKFAQLAATDSADPETYYKSLQEIERGLRKAVRMLEREEFD